MDSVVHTPANPDLEKQLQGASSGSWVPAVHVGDPRCVLALSSSLVAFEGVDQQIGALALSLSRSPQLTNKKDSKELGLSLPFIYAGFFFFNQYKLVDNLCNAMGYITC